MDGRQHLPDPNAVVPTMDVLKPSRSSTSPPAIDGVAAWWRAVCESSLAFDAQAVAALGLGVPKWVASPDKWGRRADGCQHGCQRAGAKLLEEL